MIYWDTSAIIRASRLGKVPAGLTRAHAVAEFYCVVTGPGLKVPGPTGTVNIVLSPQEAEEEAQRVFSGLAFREVTGAEALASLPKAVARNVAGRGIHDWMHATAADLGECQQVATLNTGHFARLTALPLVAPEAGLA